MALTIKFKRNEYGTTVDPTVDRIRKAARAEGWVGMAGFKDWAKENYNATLRSGKYDDWTSISFKYEDDMLHFVLKFAGE